MKNEKSFLWTCGDRFQVKISPKKKNIRVYLAEACKTKCNLSHYIMTILTSDVKRLAAGKGFEKFIDQDRFNFFSKRDEFLFVFNSTAEKLQARRVARKVLKYLEV